MKSLSLHKTLFAIAASACLLPFVPSAAALMAGAAWGLSWGNPAPELNRKLTQRFLALSIVGLGAGMDLNAVGRVGIQGILYTIVGIVGTLILGKGIGKRLGASPDVSLLVSVGTAICGGSAIAAVAPVIRAKHQDVAVALATVFLLNALALLVFPGIGHALNLEESAFGLWSALAIHDTSSVVGATLQYGSRALEVGTTVKLVRALWIIPVALFFARSRSQAGGQTDVKAAPLRRPWFILGFVVAAAVATWVPALRAPGESVELVARRVLVVTLFLIGSGITRQTMLSVGLRPLILGVTLWVLVAAGTLGGIMLDWITI